MEVGKHLRVLLQDEAGVSAIEYALLGALVAMAIVTAAAALGVNLRGFYERAASRVQDAASGG